jgi:hypothetical protein
MTLMAVLPIARGDSEGGVPMPAPPRTSIHIHFLEPAATPKSAEAAPVLVPGAANPAAKVALQFGPNVSQAAAPPPAEIATFRWSALAGSPLGYRNSPLLAWVDG